MARAANISRILETGTILGILTVLLALTGLLLSPTVMGGLGLRAAVPIAGNALYVAHLVFAVLLVAFTAVHLFPLAYAFLKKAGQTLVQRGSSFVLLALILVEIVTGYELWTHNYVPFPKGLAVLVHLLTTALLLTPLAIHSWRGFGVWRERRAAREGAMAKAVSVGKGEQAEVAASRYSRKLFLRLLTYGGAGVALAVAFGTEAKREIGSWRLNSTGATPQLTKETYRLRITGLVNNPIDLTFDDLLRMDPVKQDIVHHCVEGWTYENVFTGARLSDVLAAAGGLKPEAKMLIFKSPEVSRQWFAFGRQYTSNFPVKPGVTNSAVVAYAVGGQDLPREHGFPVRLMTPRKWGYKACKWLVEIEASPDAGYEGYWEQQGYHNDGDWPGPIFADGRGF